MTGDVIEPDMFLAARDEMIAVVEHVLAGHRPERIPERRVVTCSAYGDDGPHAELKHQWPAWRRHVAPLVVDALFALMIPAGQEPR